MAAPPLVACWWCGYHLASAQLPLGTPPIERAICTACLHLLLPPSVPRAPQRCPQCAQEGLVPGFENGDNPADHRDGHDPQRFDTGDLPE